ncbi:PAAR domain-containing protein [Pseudomonas sp. D2-30]
MKNIIRIGDKTTGNGTVQSGSTTMKFGGIGVARQGDPVDCPVPGHGRTFIAEGHPTFKDNGAPVAFAGHLCACRCALTSSMSSARAR